MTFIESNWTYDKLGRVTQQKIERNGATPQLARQDLTYWGHDDPKSLDHDLGATNHKKLEFTYDRRHQLAGVTETAAGGAFSASYQFGAAGRFAHATVTPTALTGRDVRPRNVDYLYAAADPEAVSQLVTPIGGGQTTPYADYTYDSAGNQISRTYYTDASLPTPQAVTSTWEFLYDRSAGAGSTTTPRSSGRLTISTTRHQLSSKPLPMPRWERRSRAMPGWVTGKAEALLVAIHDRAKSYAVP